MARPTRSGYPTAHSSARIPPIEPPRTTGNRSIRRWSANATSAATWSRMVIRGNREPYRRPSGAGDDGPVVPRHPPNTLAAITKNRSVSSGAPAPISPSHHPRVG